MSSLGRLMRTLWHLRASQINFQGLRRAQRKFSPERPREFPDLSAPPCSWSESVELLEPSGAGACRDWEKKRFRFIGVEGAFGKPVPWHGAGLGKLWDYNLHYFEWLWGLKPEEAKEAVDDWIRRCPFSREAVGWEPYPLSLRLMNWIGYWGTKGRCLFAADREFQEKVWRSVASQCDWLTRRLEKHLLGNHYLENGAALWVVGSFFDDARARDWQRKGADILNRELAEQVLGDGMHFERSPMYHNRLVYVLSWLSAIEGDLAGPGGEDEVVDCRVGKPPRNDQNEGKLVDCRVDTLSRNDGDEGVDCFVGKPPRNDRGGDADRPRKDGGIVGAKNRFGPLLEKTIEAAKKLTHPDEKIALLNDSAFGIYPEMGAGESPKGSFSLPETGYYGARTTRGDYIICDAGRIGPDYLPGHAHCDVLSFEMSLLGRRFITDTGVFNYENNPERHYVRSTATHNTFGPVGYEQAEIWSAFRVGRRPDVEVLEWLPEETGSFLLLAGHNGFQKGQKTPARYTRTFRFNSAGRLTLEEDFEAKAKLDWEGRLHFHPSVEVEEQTEDAVLLKRGDQQVKITFEGVDAISVRESSYHPRFNTREDRVCLKYSVHASSGRVWAVVEWT